jgi:hypothetical protein
MLLTRARTLRSQLNGKTEQRGVQSARERECDQKATIEVAPARRPQSVREPASGRALVIAVATGTRVQRVRAHQRE